MIYGTIVPQTWSFADIHIKRSPNLTSPSYKGSNGRGHHHYSPATGVYARHYRSMAVQHGVWRLRTPPWPSRKGCDGWEHALCNKLSFCCISHDRLSQSGVAKGTDMHGVLFYWYAFFWTDIECCKPYQSKLTFSWLILNRCLLI